MAVKVGVAVRNDLLQVQLRRNEIESARLNLRNNLVICRRLLSQYIGAGNDSLQVVNPISPDAVPAFPAELFVACEDALGQTPEYRLLERNVAAKRLEEKIEKGNNMPTVGVGAGYMYNNLMDKGNNSLMGFVPVSVPISGWCGGSHVVKKGL